MTSKCKTYKVCFNGSCPFRSPECPPMLSTLQSPFKTAYEILQENKDVGEKYD